MLLKLVESGGTVRFWTCYAAQGNWGATGWIGDHYRPEFGDGVADGYYYVIGEWVNYRNGGLLKGTQGPPMGAKSVP